MLLQSRRCLASCSWKRRCHVHDARVKPQCENAHRLSHGRDLAPITCTLLQWTCRVGGMRARQAAPNVIAFRDMSRLFVRTQ